MNRAHRYSGMTLAFAVVLSLIAGIVLEQAVIRSNRKPEIRTVIQAPNHVAGSIQPQAPDVRPLGTRSLITAADFNRYVVQVCPNAGLPTYATGDIVLHSEALACLVSAALSTPSNREGQAGAVTPQPFVLHPGKTPLSDPTQDAYYRSLLRDGRFPTTGSDPGRPKNDCYREWKAGETVHLPAGCLFENPGRPK